MIWGGASQSLDLIKCLIILTIFEIYAFLASLDFKYSFTFQVVPTPVVYPTPFLFIVLSYSLSRLFLWGLLGDALLSVSDKIFALSTFFLFFSLVSCPIRSINLSRVPLFKHYSLNSAPTCFSNTWLTIWYEYLTISICNSSCYYWIFISVLLSSNKIVSYLPSSKS